MTQDINSGSYLADPTRRKDPKFVNEKSHIFPDNLSSFIIICTFRKSFKHLKSFETPKSYILQFPLCFYLWKNSLKMFGLSYAPACVQHQYASGHTERGRWVNGPTHIARRMFHCLPLLTHHPHFIIDVKEECLLLISYLLLWNFSKLQVWVVKIKKIILEFFTRTFGRLYFFA